MPTVTLRDDWQQDWNSDAASSSSRTQPTQSKRNQFAGTGRLVACDVGTLDFRTQGLLHNTVGKTEYVRVRELINRIEIHPHRDELKADLRQDYVYNAFSKNSKKMIHDRGNVEYFELCETTSKVQCSYCQSCWTKGIVYCNCGICLCRTEAMRRLNRSAVALKNHLHRKSEENQKTNPTTSSRPSARRHEVLRIMPPRSSSKQENWVAILDTFFFNLVAD